MVQATVNLKERSDRILTIVKGKYGLKNKSDAINFVIEQFEEDNLEPELRPEYVKRLQSKDAKTFLSAKEAEDLDKELLQNAQ